MSATERGTEFAARPVLLVAAVVGAVQLVAAGIGGGYWFDEAYMLAIGRDHLDLGSADQPPITPALAAAVDWLAPGNIVILRLPARSSPGNSAATGVPSSSPRWPRRRRCGSPWPGTGSPRTPWNRCSGC